jgi:hypothetical protein
MGTIHGCNLERQRQNEISIEGTIFLVNVLVSNKGTLCHNMPYLYYLIMQVQIRYSTHTKFKVEMSKETQNESYMSALRQQYYKSLCLFEVGSM